MEKRGHKKKARRCLDAGVPQETQEEIRTSLEEDNLLREKAPEKGS